MIELIAGTDTGWAWLGLRPALIYFSCKGLSVGAGTHQAVTLRNSRNLLEKEERTGLEIPNESLE